MDDLERRLRQLQDLPPASFDPAGTLSDVVTSGQRKVAARVGAGGVVVAALALALMVVPGWSGSNASIEIIGSGGSPTTAEETAPEATPVPVETATQRVEPLEPGPTPSTPTTPSPIPSTPPRVELDLDMTMEKSHAYGQPITFEVIACNRTDHVHEEFFFNEGERFDLGIITADDRRIAYTRRNGGGPWTTETWQPGECRSWTETWDQTEGAFADPDDGPQAEPGEYTVELSWWGVEPPPPGIEPGLYDPAARIPPPPFGPFTIEEPEATEPPLG